MKLKIGDCVVEVTAKRTLCDEEEDCTEMFLNELSIAYGNSVEWARDRGYRATVDAYREKAHDVYDALDNVGYYDDLKEA